MVSGIENLCFVVALKRYISETILPEKTLKVIKIVFFKIKVTTYIPELLNLGVKITPPNRSLHCKSLPELPPL